MQVPNAPDIGHTLHRALLLCNSLDMQGLVLGTIADQLFLRNSGNLVGLVALEH